MKRRKIAGRISGKRPASQPFYQLSLRSLIQLEVIILAMTMRAIRASVLNSDKWVRQLSTSTARAKGSFLLNTPKEISDAAKAASMLNMAKLKPGKNEEVGRALIAERDRHMGPNVSVFYKQDGGLVITGGQGNRHILKKKNCSQILVIWSYSSHCGMWASYLHTFDS